MFNNTDDENKKQIPAYITVLLSILLIIVALSAVILYFYYGKKAIDQKYGFSYKELNESIKKVDQYQDTVKRELFGITYNFDNNKFNVVDVIPESPAKKAGIKKGDTIIKVNEVDTKKLNAETEAKIAEALLNNTTKFQVKRKGEKKNREFNLTKEEIDTKNVCGCECIAALYTNSLGYNEKYVFGYFKVPQGEKDYTKTGIICACGEDNKELTTFWSGIYRNGKLEQVDNYLKKGKLIKTKVEPGEPSGYMCNTLCIQKANNYKPNETTEKETKEKK